MARKNPFANLMDDQAPQPSEPRLDYTIKGASKSILSSIDEMAARADKLLEGQTVVEIDPADIDASFVRDRLAEESEDDLILLEAIREQGQQSPVLLRPHPTAPGRYMVVFGHRRVRAADELGRRVKAVIRQLSDREHVVAQGQENSARANLSFIEKALFAAELQRLNYDGDNQTVMAALSVDRATLSKLLSVAALPPALLKAIGPARGIGRDRWYELKMLLEKPSVMEAAVAHATGAGFEAGLSSDERFNRVVAFAKAARKPARAPSRITARNWSSDDRGLTVDIKGDGKTMTFALKSKEAAGFGDYVSRNLEQLYAAYLAGKKD